MWKALSDSFSPLSNVWPMSAANGYEPVSRALAALRNHPCVDVEVRLGGDAWTVRWVRPANVLVLGAGPDAEGEESAGKKGSSKSKKKGR